MLHITNTPVKIPMVLLGALCMFGGGYFSSDSLITAASLVVVGVFMALIGSWIFPEKAAMAIREEALIDVDSELEAQIDWMNLNKCEWAIPGLKMARKRILNNVSRRIPPNGSMESL